MKTTTKITTRPRLMLSAGLLILGGAFSVALAQPTQAAPRRDNDVRRERRDVERARRDVERERRDVQQARTPAERRQEQRELDRARQNVRRQRDDVSQERHEDRFDTNRRGSGYNRSNSGYNRSNSGYNRSNSGSNRPGYNGSGYNRPGSGNYGNYGNGSYGNQSYTGTVTSVRSDNSVDVRINGTTFNVYTNSRLPRGLSVGDQVRVSGVQQNKNDIRQASVSILRDR